MPGSPSIIFEDPPRVHSSSLLTDVSWGNTLSGLINALWPRGSCHFVINPKVSILVWSINHWVLTYLLLRFRELWNWDSDLRIWWAPQGSVIANPHQRGQRVPQITIHLHPLLLSFTQGRCTYWGPTLSGAVLEGVAVKMIRPILTLLEATVQRGKQYF